MYAVEKGESYMDKPTILNEHDFNVNHKYSMFAGWLIIPAISTLLTLTGSLIMAIFVNPTQLKEFELFIYSTDILFIPMILLIYYMWFKRKKTLPYLMVFYFLLHIIWNVTYYINGHHIDLFMIAMSLFWSIYFIKSKRVKATFTR